MESKIEELQNKVKQSLTSILPTFTSLPAHVQNRLCESFLLDLVAEQGIPASGSLTVLERKGDAEIQAVIELLDFTKVSTDLINFYQRKATIVSDAHPDPEV